VHSRTVGRELEGVSSVRKQILMPRQRIDPAEPPHPITVVPLDERDEFASLTDESPRALEDPWNFSEPMHTSSQPQQDPGPLGPTHQLVARPVRAAAPKPKAVPSRSPYEVELPLQQFGVLSGTMAAAKAHRPRRLVSALLVAAVAAVVAFMGSPWIGGDLGVPAVARSALETISHWSHLLRSSAPSVQVPAAPSDADADRAVATAEQAIPLEPSAPVPSKPVALPAGLPETISSAAPTATSGPANSRERAVITPRDTQHPRVSSQSVAVADADNDVEPDPATVAVVRNVLLRFRRAYEDMNLLAVRQVWPSAAEAELASGFDGLQSQRVNFDDCSVRLRGDAASAACRGSVQQILRTGRGTRRVEGRVWIFTLRRVGTDWEIVTARFTSFAA